LSLNVGRRAPLAVFEAVDFNWILKCLRKFCRDERVFLYKLNNRACPLII
jgi:hypothetical protein